ncbi:MAG: heliorhodopsin HeR [Thermoleophilia bacterium]
MTRLEVRHAPPYPRLRRWNLALAVLHTGQGAAILALGSGATIPITWSFLDGPPSSASQTTSTLYDLPFAPAVAVFLFLAALDHGATAIGPGRRWYERNVARGINPARWYEYSLSASLMIVLIAMLTGIRDLSALIALFGVNAAMILFGLLMEQVNRPGERVRWSPFVLGCVAGVVPWIAIAVQLAHSAAEANVPGFVYGIFFSLFVLFASFALNQWLQYRGVGPWRDYLFGERGYLALSLVAKSVLAWQVFAGALA